MEETHNLIKTETVAEVVSSTITGWVAEMFGVERACLGAEEGRPRFGSFLTAEGEGAKVYGVVFDLVTQSPDNLHRPSALGLTREELKAQQPQIFALLRTQIHAVTIGYSQGGAFFPHLPPHPPQVHDFVAPATREEVVAISDGLDYLRLLAAVSTVPADELLSASVRAAHQARGQDYEFLVKAGQAISNLFREDYDRLMAVLRNIRP